MEGYLLPKLLDTNNVRLKEIYSILKGLKKEDLKGEAAHIDAYPPFRLALYKDTRPTDRTKRSAVLILFYEIEGNTYFCLIKRPKYDGPHSSQVAFPGGKFENGDHNLTQTALREAEEEVGVDTSTIVVLNELSTLYIPVSDFTVKPILAATHTPPHFRPSVSEVEYIIQVNVDMLLSTNLETVEVATPKGSIMAPSFLLENEKIWGATAMILNELKGLLLPKRG